MNVTARIATSLLSAALSIGACAPRSVAASSAAAAMAATPAPSLASEGLAPGDASEKQCPHNCLRSQRDANGCCVMPAAARPAGWTTFNSPEGRFSIDLPGAPRQQQQTLNTAAGPIQMFTYIHEFAQGSRAYMISFNDYPAAIVARGNAQRMLDGARDGAVRNVNGSLISERRFTLGRYPARELQIRVPSQGALVMARLYLVGARLYQTLALARENDPVAEENRFFLESFHLTP